MKNVILKSQLTQILRLDYLINLRSFKAQLKNYYHKKLHLLAVHFELK